MVVGPGDFKKMLNPHQWHGLRRLTAYLRRHRGRLAAGFICILLTNLFLLAAPRVMGYAVDQLQESVSLALRFLKVA